MSTWIEEHLETFVKPHLGRIPNMPTGINFTSKETGYHVTLTPQVIETLVRCWVFGKEMAAGRPILFPGRDAWLVHALGGQEGEATLMHPELSRSVATAHLVDKRMFAGCFLVDCGTVGTIPAMLGIKEFALTSYATVGGNPGGKPLLRGHPDSVYNFMTAHPKYWTHAEPKNGKVEQNFSCEHDFEQCAALTRLFLKEVYESNSNPLKILRGDMQ